jgi:uncharacterized protein YcbK (DUF882 family)
MLRGVARMCAVIGFSCGVLSMDANPSQADLRRGLQPSLRAALVKIERRFGKPVQVTSGCRSFRSNRLAGGRRGSYHLRCMAADIRVAGVSSRQIISFVKSLPSIGGVGTYCGKSIVHIDTGPERRWSGGCGRRHPLRGVRRYASRQ